jgi:hypothetical protein
MGTMTSIVIAVLVAIAVVGIAAWTLYQKHRTEKLRGRFGPEYVREIQETGDRRRAEAKLEQREERVDHLHVRPLTRANRARFIDSWRIVQARFVDNPGAAIAEADQLLGDVMSARGYPVADFEQRAADISVDHPLVVENYRAAHEIALRHSRGGASTEDLRQAIIHYRTLFEDLIAETEEMRVRIAS